MRTDIVTRIHSPGIVTLTHFAMQTLHSDRVWITSALPQPDSYAERMHWDNLFEDLAGQLESELEDESRRLQVEEERLRVSRLTLRDRIVALASGRADGETLRVLLEDDRVITIAPTGFGKDWIAADIVGESRRVTQCIVPVSGISSVLLDREQVRRSLDLMPIPAPSDLSQRLGIVFPLRDLGHRRRMCEFVTLRGAIVGTIDRVARDHIDVAVHERGDPRRNSLVTHYRIVPISELLLVRIERG